MKYDIIGDIHGQVSKLISLLEKLEYRKIQGVYQKEGHQVIFLGDFIDRGEQQEQVINIVRPMIDEGKALAVMGNHEFNAICYHTFNEGKYLREHSDKNFRQHKSFLQEYPVGQSETNDVIEWFKTLPLFLELENKFRVIHACWDQDVIENLQLKGYLNEGGSLKVEFFVQTVQKENELHQALEMLLKGKEMRLPFGGSFQDKDGNERQEIRVKWWQNNLKTFQQASVLEIDALINQDDIPLPEGSFFWGYPENEIPVFFGHYWFTGKVRVLSGNVACLDYSAAKAGPLVAYQWSEPGELQGENFLSSDPLKCSKM